MKRLLTSLLLILVLSGCSLNSLKSPTATPTSLPIIASPTPMLASATPSIPTASPTMNLPSPTQGETAPPPPTATVPLPTATSGGGGTVPGNPSGPYAIVGIASGDVLNIRSAAGADKPIVGSFAANTTGIMRTGPSANAGGNLWVEVQNPAGGNGWVNASFLTEYAAPASFCANTVVTALITALDSALTTKNGVALQGLTSPAHGMTVYLWRYGNSVTFMPNDARWVFDSTYEHNWGEAPGSGLVTKGSFHVAVLPFLQEVFNASYTLTCNSLGSVPHYGEDPWPTEYANMNYYTVFKPGTPGVDLDFRFFLVGVEFVQGQPYVFALIHFAWEP